MAVKRPAALVALILTGSAAAAGASSGTTAAVRDCTPTEAQQLVVDFTVAFNAGNTRRLNRIFAKEPAFEWYSAGKPGDRAGREARNRSTLMRYFRARHRQHERLQFVWMGGGNAYGLFQFPFHLVRQARNLPAAVHEGKGAILCTTRSVTIVVWSWGPPVTPP